MGAYSTVTISREYAIEKIMALLYDASNDEVSSALFALTENHTLDNYCVVDELDGTGFRETESI